MRARARAAQPAPRCVVGTAEYARYEAVPPPCGCPGAGVPQDTAPGRHGLPDPSRARRPAARRGVRHHEATLWNRGC